MYRRTNRWSLTAPCLAALLTLSAGYSQETPELSAKGLLISGYRSGVETGWGIYQWDETNNDLRLLLDGGRHPQYLENGRYWACYWNGTARFFGAGRAERTLGMEGYVTDTRRFVQSTGGGEALVMMASPFGGSWPIELSLSRLFGTPAAVLSPSAVLAEDDILCSDLWRFLDLAPGRPHLFRVSDFAVSREGDRVALVVEKRLWDVGAQESRVLLYELRTRSLRSITPGSPAQLQMNPHWLANGRALAFDAVDAATGTRTTWLADLAGNAVTKFVPKLAEKQPPSTWVFDTSPNGEFLALGAGWEDPPPKRPVTLLVCRRNGEVVGRSHPCAALWEAHWSPDGKRIAYVFASQLNGDFEPFQTDAIGLSVGLMSTDSAVRRPLTLCAPSHEVGRKGPVVPYEVAW